MPCDEVESAVRQLAQSIGYCGLVCGLCHLADRCGGCRSNSSCCGMRLSPQGCFQYNCCMRKGIQGCWECEQAPCGEGMFSSEHDVRNRVFVVCAKQEGILKLAEYVEVNRRRGIRYGYNKDYDNLGGEQAVWDLLHADPKKEAHP